MNLLIEQTTTHLSDLNLNFVINSLKRVLANPNHSYLRHKREKREKRKEKREERREKRKEKREKREEKREKRKKRREKREERREKREERREKCYLLLYISSITP